jgi:hypothetical protein
MESRIISDIEPTSVYTGRIWVKPGIGFFIRMGSQWIPLISEAEDISFRRTTLLINGVDRSDLLEKGSLTIEDILTKQVDLCSLNLFDLKGLARPKVGQEVLIFHKPTSTSDPEIRFAGKIDVRPQEQFANDEYNYQLQISDFSQELNRNLVTEVYENETEGDIIKDIIENYAPALGTFHVEDGVTVDRIVFNNKFPMQCIQELASRTGRDFYVDYERNLHYFSRDTNIAPYELDDTSLDGNYHNLIITVDKTQLINRQKVKGGFELSDDYTQLKDADGVQTSFQLDYQPFDADSGEVEIYKNSVKSTSVGIDNIDDPASKEWLLNVAEQVVKLGTQTMGAGDEFKAIYKFKKPILVQVQDDDSIALMKQLEGGDGIYEGDLIINDEIETKQEAREFGRARLRDTANPLVVGTFETTQNGYRSGQLLTINIPSRDVPCDTVQNQYLIQRVSSTSFGRGNFDTVVEFATRLKGITEFLLEIYDSGKVIFERTDELLEQLRIFSESFGIGETKQEATLRNTTTDPYKWSNDAGTTPGKGQYNLASWG